MNRRSFLKSLGVFAILPAATTYPRLWKAVRMDPEWGVNPEWRDAPYEVVFFNRDLNKPLDFPFNYEPRPFRFVLGDDGIFKPVAVDRAGVV
jgi:hypothetical protein